MERMDSLTGQNGRTPAVLDENTAFENAKDIYAFLQNEKERIKLERIELAERQKQLENIIRSFESLEKTLSVLEKKELPSALKDIATAKYR